MDRLATGLAFDRGPTAWVGCARSSRIATRVEDGSCLVTPLAGRYIVVENSVVTPLAKALLYLRSVEIRSWCGREEWWSEGVE